MLLGILLTIHILVCVALIGVVLLQRSEGGALGMGGGPSGFITARGAGDLLTRTTWVLAGLFVVLSLTLTLLTGRESATSSIVNKRDIERIDPKKLNLKPEPAQPNPAAPPAAPADPFAAPQPTVRTPGQEPAPPAPANP